MSVRLVLVPVGVAATPGMDFDPVNGHQFVRFSFCGSTEDTIEAAARLQKWMEERRKDAAA